MDLVTVGFGPAPGSVPHFRLHPEDVMPEGYGPVWICDLWPGKRMITTPKEAELEGVFEPRYRLDYLDFGPSLLPSEKIMEWVAGSRKSTDKV